MTTMEQAMATNPLVAILRGIQPHEAVDAALALYDDSFRCIEVPLNSPDPYTSIRAMTEAVPSDCITGAGTVLTVDAVHMVQDAGGRIIVTPNTNAEVIKAAVAAGMIAVPGVATATEALVAVDAGARILKLFPASTYGTGHLKALASVLPKDVQFVVTGGINASNIADWKTAGAQGYGIGGDLYKPGDTPDDIRAKAKSLLAAIAA